MELTSAVTVSTRTTACLARVVEAYLLAIAEESAQINEQVRVSVYAWPTPKKAGLGTGTTRTVQSAASTISTAINATRALN